MNPYEFINFKKEDFKFNCTKESGFTEEQSNEIFEITNIYIKRLEEIRHSEKRTGEIVNELINYTERHNGMQSFSILDPKYDLIIQWLTKAVWVDPTYYWAKKRLGRYINRKMDGIVYDTVNERMSEPELFEILNEELQFANHNLDNSVLLKALRKYITGINAIGFSNIIQHHSLLPGSQRALWIGKSVDAHRFATFFKMKIKKWNECFTGLQKQDGTPRPLRDNDKNDTNSAIEDILMKHLAK